MIVLRRNQEVISHMPEEGGWNAFMALWNHALSADVDFTVAMASADNKPVTIEIRPENHSWGQVAIHHGDTHVYYTARPEGIESL